MFDLMGMMGKVKEMQGKMKEVQEKVSKLQLTSESGAGLVKATINGNRQIIKLDIDDSLLNIADKEVLQDLITAAINKAVQDIDLKIKDEMQTATQGVLPNIPGFDLNSLMNS